MVPLLAAIGHTRDGWRVAVSGIIFKVLGVVVIVPILSIFTSFVEAISPPILIRQIANAHTLFNVVVAILFLPFSKQVSNFVRVLVPEKVISYQLKVNKVMLLFIFLTFLFRMKFSSIKISFILCH